MSEYPDYDPDLVRTRAKRFEPTGPTLRQWMVGQLVSGPLMGQGAIPPLKEIWDLADKLLAAGERQTVEEIGAEAQGCYPSDESPPDTF